MALSSTAEVGMKLKKSEDRLDTVEQNISPNEDSAIDTLTFSEELTVGGSLSVYKRRMSEVLIPEHPIYGEVGGEVVTIPVTMPVQDQGYPVGPFLVLGHPRWGKLNDAILAEDGSEYERTLLNTYVV